MPGGDAVLSGPVRSPRSVSSVGRSRVRARERSVFAVWGRGVRLPSPKMASRTGMRRPWVWMLALLAAATDPAHGAGRVVTGLEGASPVLGHPIRYSAYLPADPMPDGERYPVVYLLHGYRGNEM